MYYNSFQNLKLSAMGFGLMRLPCKEDGTIDQERFETMVEAAMKAGVNYYDTAWPYHGGMSEIAAGKALGKFPRESYYLASKYPGHQTADAYEPAVVFEKQLEKCGVDYFDFYLLHNVMETSYPVYDDPQWGIIDYFVEQRRLGRIKHLGFSSHARIETLTAFLDKYGHLIEFCQIQLNYVDWTLQNAREKVQLLNDRHIPIWVMEPVRGGKLAAFPEGTGQGLNRGTPASYALRWLQGIEGVTMILSGMSTEEQMEDNLNTFASRCPTTEEENLRLYEIADALSRSVPCTACRYCCDGCPLGLDIPTLISTYNEICVAPVTNATMYLEGLPEGKLPSACVGCGQCTRICPQHIDVPGVMGRLSEKLTTIPKWSDICRQRAEEAKRLK